jgi:hypothetical protein
VDSTPNGCRERDRMANEKNRDNNKIKLMEKYPDWDWDYWGCQIE